MFAPEVTNLLKQAMIAAVERNGDDYGEGCYFSEEDMVSIMNAVARAGSDATRDNVIRWAQNFRELNVDPEHRALFLKTENVEDKNEKVGNCLVVCFCTGDIPDTGLVINKTRGSGVFNISAQLIVRSTVTNETRIFLEKPAIYNSILYKALASVLGATQIQIFSFTRNNSNPAEYARKNVEKFALRPGAQVVRIGTLKTRYEPPAVPEPPAGPVKENNAELIATVNNLSSAVATHAQVDATHAGAADKNAETIARLGSDLAHQRSLVHKSNGALGARVRTENTETRRENKRMKVDIEERQKREQQAFEREQQAAERERMLMQQAHDEKMMLLEQIKVLMATNAQLVARIQ